MSLDQIADAVSDLVPTCPRLKPISKALDRLSAQPPMDPFHFAARAQYEQRITFWRTLAILAMCASLLSIVF